MSAPRRFPLVPQPKGAPRIIARLARGRAAVALDRAQKNLVRARDLEACRVCGIATRDVHERLFKSLGGVASLANSMCACRLCHPYLQGHAITVFGQDCNHPLTFEMPAIVAKHVFRGRLVPPSVVVGP